MKSKFTFGLLRTQFINRQLRATKTHKYIFNSRSAHGLLEGGYNTISLFGTATAKGTNELLYP